VAWLGKSGRKDWHIMSLALSEDWTLVTNDAVDFRVRYGKASVHPGLIIIVPQVRIPEQQRAFAVVLCHIAGRELINRIVECRISAAEIAISEYEMPLP
jgi:hypothetical protein